jgi:hypothetical protein
MPDGLRRENDMRLATLAAATVVAALAARTLHDRRVAAQRWREATAGG